MISDHTHSHSKNFSGSIGGLSFLCVCNPNGVLIVGPTSLVPKNFPFTAVLYKMVLLVCYIAGVAKLRLASRMQRFEEPHATL